MSQQAGHSAGNKRKKGRGGEFDEKSQGKFSKTQNVDLKKS